MSFYVPYFTSLQDSEFDIAGEVHKLEFRMEQIRTSGC